MPDKFFLLYANKLFKDDPENLKVVFQDVIERRKILSKEHGLYIAHDEVRLEYLAEMIDTFSNSSDFDQALKWKSKIKSKAQMEQNERKPYDLSSLDRDVDVAFEAVFYYKTGWCDCTWHENGSCIGYRSDQHDFGLDENIRLKCHECCQLFFRGMLMDCVSSKDFLEMGIHKMDASLLDEKWLKEEFPETNSIFCIDTASPKSFQYYVSRAYDCVEIGAHTTNKHVIKKEFFSLTNLLDDKRSIYPLYTRFNDYLISVVSYSLIEFLRKNEHKKLKLCPFCNNFFIAKSINRKTRCYEPGCDKAYQRDKKRKQRDKEPDIYY